MRHARKIKNPARVIQKKALHKRKHKKSNSNKDVPLFRRASFPRRLFLLLVAFAFAQVQVMICMWQVGSFQGKSRARWNSSTGD